MASAERATQRGLGMAAAVSPEVIGAAAIAVQAAGYHSFWLNNPPGGNALELLGGVAGRMPDLWLGVGVIPLSHSPAAQITAALRRYELPLDRFYLGIGSGSGAGGVARVAEGVRALREEIDCFIVVAALGPRMSRLAGEVADGVLFNWLTPAYATQSTEWVLEGAERAGRPLPRLMAYVRTALGDEAITRLEREAANYAAIPHYAEHFNRMRAAATDTAVRGTTPLGIERGLAAWNGVVDEVVVRAITAHDSEAEVLDLVAAAAPPG